MRTLMVSSPGSCGSFSAAGFLPFYSQDCPQTLNLATAPKLLLITENDNQSNRLQPNQNIITTKHINCLSQSKPIHHPVKLFQTSKMCLLPCWPCNDFYLEEEPKKKPEKGTLVYDPNARTVVKITGKVPVSLPLFMS
jgi:hypothetical protein